MKRLEQVLVHLSTHLPSGSVVSALTCMLACMLTSTWRNSRACTWADAKGVFKIRGGKTETSIQELVFR